MGYDCIGSYFVFGIPIDIQEYDEKLDTYHPFTEHRVFVDSKHPHVSVVRYGFEEENKYFLCWGPVYLGGAFWPQLKSRNKRVKNLPVRSVETFLRNNEVTFQKREVKQFLRNYQLQQSYDRQTFRWQTLVVCQ